MTPEVDRALGVREPNVLGWERFTGALDDLTHQIGSPHEESGATGSKHEAGTWPIRTEDSSVTSDPSRPSSSHALALLDRHGVDADALCLPRPVPNPEQPKREQVQRVPVPP